MARDHPYYLHGSVNECCQICGGHYKAHQMRYQWDRIKACHGAGTANCWSPKHPQLDIRSKIDNPSRPWAISCPGIYCVPSARDDLYTVCGGDTVSTPVLDNDNIQGVQSITFTNLPDAGTVGVFSYTDSAAANQTVTEGVTIAIADFNSPIFTPVATVAEQRYTGIVYTAVDEIGATVTANVTLDLCESPLPSPPRHNLFFAFEASDFAMSANGGAATTLGNLNYDPTKSAKLFDAMIATKNDILRGLIEGGMAPDSPVQIVSYESQLQGESEPIDAAVKLTSGAQTIFRADTDFDPIYAAEAAGGYPFGDNESDLVDQGVAYFVPPLEAADAFFAESELASNDRNIIFLMAATVGTDYPGVLQTAVEDVVDNHNAYIETISFGASTFGSPIANLEGYAVVHTGGTDNADGFVGPNLSGSDVMADYIRGLTDLIVQPAGATENKLALTSGDNLLLTDGTSGLKLEI